jgi:hypothetical protein
MKGSVLPGAIEGAGRISRYTRPHNKNVEIGNRLFLEFRHQIRLQKYKISLLETNS